MIGAAILIAMMFFGLMLAGVIGDNSEYGAPFWRYVGWAMVLFPIIRFRVIWEGIRRSGALLAFALAVAVLAAVFSGEGALWNFFF